MRKITLVVLQLLLSNVSIASEIDDISVYYEKVADSNLGLSKKVQEAIDKGLSESEGCDMEAFGKIVAGELVSMRYYSGAMEKYSWESPDVSRLKVTIKQSIYNNTPLASSVIGRIYGLDPSINLGGHVVGTDKVGHFIDHGYKLYKISASGGSPEQMLEHAVGEEEGAFGWYTTGIKSYADLAANFDGYQFWKEIYGKGKKPYVTCKNGKLTKARPFSFAEFTTAAWSEAINCNDYSEIQAPVDVDDATDALHNQAPKSGPCPDVLKAPEKSEFLAAVEKNMKALEAKLGKRFTCPIEPEKCSKIRSTYAARYGDSTAAGIISPRCK